MKKILFYFTILLLVISISSDGQYRFKALQDQLKTDGYKLMDTLDRSAIVGYDLFIDAGQSNMTASAIDTANEPKIPYINGSPISYKYLNGKITVANDPVNSGGAGSSWPSFAIRWYQLTGRKTLVINVAQGGSTQLEVDDLAAVGSWQPSATVRNLYKKSIDTINAAMTAFVNAGFSFKLKGIRWGQGEGDGTIHYGTVPSSTYRDTLKAMIGAYRVALKDSTLPFWINRTGVQLTDGPSFTYASDNADSVREMQEQVAATYPYTWIVFRNAVDFPNQNKMRLGQSTLVHYNMAGLIEMGQVGAENIFKVSSDNKGIVGNRRTTNVDFIVPTTENYIPSNLPSLALLSQSTKKSIFRGDISIDSTANRLRFHLLSNLLDLNTSTYSDFVIQHFGNSRVEVGNISSNVSPAQSLVFGIASNSFGSGIVGGGGGYFEIIGNAAPFFGYRRGSSASGAFAQDWFNFSGSSGRQIARGLYYTRNQSSTAITDGFDIIWTDSSNTSSGTHYPLRIGSSTLNRGGGTVTDIFSVDQNGTTYQGAISNSVGTGSPEGAVSAVVGSTYRNRNGGAGTTFYVKETGTGNTGWAPK